MEKKQSSLFSARSAWLLDHRGSRRILRRAICFWRDRPAEIQANKQSLAVLKGDHADLVLEEKLKAFLVFGQAGVDRSDSDGAGAMSRRFRSEWSC